MNYLLFLLSCLFGLSCAAIPNRAKRQAQPTYGSPWDLQSFSQGFNLGNSPPNAANNNPLSYLTKDPISTVSGVIKSLSGAPEETKQFNPNQFNQFPQTSQSLDDFDFNAPREKIDLGGFASGNVAGLAPIPVPGFPGPQDIPRIPGVNTIPGLDMWNYLIGQLIPQAVPATNALLGDSVSRLLPQDTTKNMASDVFKALHPPATPVNVARMMGRWFQVINSPHVIREACTVSHFGALTNNTYSATFTMLKFYREGNANGPPRFSLGYGFQSGDDGQFVIHQSNSPDSEPFWVVRTGPLNEFNQYDYAIVSNWVKFPVFVIARDPARFKQQHMADVLRWLEEKQYINVLTKAFNLIAPVDYSQCQYTPTFSGAGK